jgi:hypothetical protein
MNNCRKLHGMEITKNSALLLGRPLCAADHDLRAMFRPVYLSQLKVEMPPATSLDLNL